MSAVMIQLLQKKAPQFATQEEVSSLIHRLQNAEQTIDKDHCILAHLLDVSVRIHHANGAEEVVADLGTTSRQVHMRLLEKADGAGTSHGHFDLLWPDAESNKSFCEVCPTEHCEPEPSTVAFGLTVRGVELAAGILDGRKNIENRNFALEGSWIALHVAKSDSLQHIKKQMHHLLPGDEGQSNLQKGHIVGLIFFGKSLTLAEYRKSVGCGEECNFSGSGTLSIPKHAEACRANPLVFGPVINVIKHRIAFTESFPANGNVAKWGLSDDARKKISQLLKDGKYTEASNWEEGPHPWPFSWLPVGARREPEACCWEQSHTHTHIFI